MLIYKYMVAKALQSIIINCRVKKLFKLIDTRRFTVH